MTGDEGPTLHQLRCFVSVADEGQFTAAADYLGIAQPSLSSQIGRLEQILGVDLFLRTHRPVALTDAGQALLPIARRALGSIDDVVRAVAEVEDLQRGHVTVGATPSLGGTLLPRVLARFHEHHPKITLSVYERHSDDLARQLENGSLDLAVAILPMRRGSLEHTVLAIEELVVMVPADHPLAKQSEVRLEQLRDVPLIMFREGYNLRSATLGAFERAGFAPQVALDGVEISSVRAFVRAGIGAAVVPGIVAGTDPDVVVRPLISPSIERMIGLVLPASRPPSRSAAALIQEITDFLQSGEWRHEGAVGFRLATDAARTPQRQPETPKVRV
ncbi:MAG TPA: LysR family transcriptional regulator [Acidimicrobiales bacterium]